MQLIEKETKKLLLAELEFASSWWQRFRGLMFRRRFPKGYGLWLDRCSSIHTMWMRVPIDVYFLDREGVVLEHHEQVRPWSVAVPKQKAHAVLEIPFPEFKVVVGSQLVVEAS